MAAQPLSPVLSPQHLSPQLRMVLSSLSISLEAELNRYRRNRHYQGLAKADLFAELEDPSFDLEALEQEVEVSIAQTVATAKPITPPPVPRNKKLLPQANAEIGEVIATTTSPASKALETSSAMVKTALAIAPATPHPTPEHPSENTPLPTPPGSSLALKSTATQQSDTQQNTSHSSEILPKGYLTSSEQLIESLAELPPLPDPVDTFGKPKRKTVSLLAGATLGFFGLTAGLSASYLMANPTVTQRLAERFKGSPNVTTVDTISTFDPPGPDLSANEFIDLEIDNLSSLKMPQVSVLPGEAPPTPPTKTLESDLSDPTTNLPAIQSSGATAPTATPTIASTSTGLPAIPTAPTATPTTTSTSIGTQAVVVPVGLTYYVTAPVTTEQGLTTLRQTVGEAFVRRFADGNRIQIGAFDNPQAAQAMLTELKGKNIVAQIYGPTTE